MSILYMDVLRLIGVVIVEYPIYLLSSKYDYSRFWNKCIQINTLYTKVMQAVAIQYMSNEHCFHFNNIPYTSKEIQPVEYLTPSKVIGSGMISIVYEATDEQGKIYVIKTKRKGIDEKVMNGLQQIKNIIRWLKYLPYSYIFNIDFIFNQIEYMMIEQLSFENEIKNHKRFKLNMEYTTDIIVPDIYDEYCTPTQIVMSKIEGEHYTSFSDEVRSQYAKKVVEMSAKNLILDGFIHSDLHAGNIIFTPDNKIGIIDFGLMIQLTSKDRQTFFDALKQFAIHDYSKAVDIIISEFIGPDSIKKSLSSSEYTRLHNTFQIVLYTIYSVNKSFNIKDVHNVIQIVNTYKLNISNCFYNLMIFIVSCECLIKELSPMYIEIFMEKIKVLAEFDTE